MTTTGEQPQRDRARDTAIIEPSQAMIDQAWREGEELAMEFQRPGRHHGNQRDLTSATWQNVTGRVAELSVEYWLGLPLMPKMERSHFDTHAPWAAQVRSYAYTSSDIALYINADRSDCMDCPWILARVRDVCLVELLGWATGHEVRQHGYALTWASGHRSWALPGAKLHPLPGPTTLQARGFRRGKHSICQRGRLS